jgi:hypothetical protein
MRGRILIALGSIHSAGKNRVPSNDDRTYRYVFVGSGLSCQSQSNFKVLFVRGTH